MDVPFIEQVKIQAQVLVPLVKALRAELGEERANALVRKALGGLYRKVGEDWWRREETGEFLRSLFFEGTRPSSEGVAARIGFDPHDTAPLEEELTG